MLARILVYVLIAWSAIACRSAQEETSIEVTVIADGSRDTSSFTRDLTVDQALTGARIELGPRDRIATRWYPRPSWHAQTIRPGIRNGDLKQEEIAYRRSCCRRKASPRRARTGKAGVMAFGGYAIGSCWKMRRGDASNLACRPSYANRSMKSSIWDEQSVQS